MMTYKRTNNKDLWSSCKSNGIIYHFQIKAHSKNVTSNIPESLSWNFFQNQVSHTKYTSGIKFTFVVEHASFIRDT